MNRSVEQALATLLPAMAEELPRELVNLAASLLSQSRTCAASLKPEVEIARPYACSEIACTRLSRSLKLPSPLSRPPCPPRVYKKLYTYIEQALETSSASLKRQTQSEPRTPSRSSARIHDRIAAAPPALPTPTATSSALSSPQRTRKPINSNHRPPAAAGQAAAAAAGDEQPRWIMDSIRAVCRIVPSLSLATRIPSIDKFAVALPPHVYAGVCSVKSLISASDATIPDKWRDFVSPCRLVDSHHKATVDRTSSLIIAVFFIVYARRLGVVYDGDKQNYPDDPLVSMTEDHMEQTIGKALDTLQLPRTVEGEINEWLVLILRMNWAIGQQWFENVPLPTIQEIEAALNLRSMGRKRFNSGADDDQGDEIVGPRQKMARSREARAERRLMHAEEAGDTLLPGLGTMMNPQIDWLSEDKRDSFSTWRDNIMAWMDQVEIS